MSSWGMRKTNLSKHTDLNVGVELLIDILNPNYLYKVLTAASISVKKTQNIENR
jgi:hypothetical protein